MSPDALLLELETTREELRREREALRLEREVRAAREAELRAKSDEVARLLAENAGLRARVDLLARRMFGRSSEKIDPGQLLLAFEVAQAEAKAEDSLETAAGEETEATPRPRRVRPTKKKGMADLPVREVRVEPDEEARRCAHGHERTRIGEEGIRRAREAEMPLAREVNPAGGHAEPFAVVRDLEARFFSIKREAHLHLRRLGVPNDVSQGLLEHPE